MKRAASHRLSSMLPLKLRFPLVNQNIIPTRGSDCGHLAKVIIGPVDQTSSIDGLRFQELTCQSEKRVRQSPTSFIRIMASNACDVSCSNRGFARDPHAAIRAASSRAFCRFCQTRRSNRRCRWARDREEMEPACNLRHH